MKHNTLLHQSGPTNSDQRYPEKSSNMQGSSATNLAARTKDIQGGYVFLGTAVADTTDTDGKTVSCRILLDSGSQLNFISERLRKKLRLTNDKVNLNISGIGDSKVKITDRMNLTIKSRLNNYATQIQAFVIKEIATHQPQQYINTDNWEIPSNITLADPDFNKPQRIDILVGAELYGELMRNGQIKLNENLPMLQNTTLGWIVLGKVATIDYKKPFCGITNLELENQLHHFWEIEECPTKQLMSITDKKCEEFFTSTTYRNDEGRYVVSLPMLSDPHLLGESKDAAFRRLLSIEKRLMREASLQKQYNAFLEEYLELGHMQEFNPKLLTKPYFFLPHHYVLKPTSSTTKLRVVFDASAKTSNNLSLNDLLLNGPKIQDDLISIILRFRTKRYVFTADIAKMYRQIRIAEEDQKLQMIMWRKNPLDPVKYYQLCTVTYGTKSAPYLAVKCLQKLAEDEGHNYPLGAAAIKDFYVDDVLTGSDNLHEAINMQKQLNSLLKLGGFQLRKWCANHPQLIENIPREDLEIKLNFSDLDNEQVKTLGLVWEPITDFFAVTSTLKTYKSITKRTILAEMSQIFDPLGLVNPVVVMSKIFMQYLWKLKLNWDDELPLELHSKWLQFRKELNKLNEIKIPRYMFNNEQPKAVKLHAFADASEKAYGCALYLSSKDELNNVTVRLLCAKSRVAPVKPTTLPRLELCAAKLATKLVAHVINVINIEFSEIYYWTDSQIVLSWVQGDASTLKTFVANRVAYIQEVTQGKNWRYVNTKENPADLVSRGIFPEQLKLSKLWFNGPEFLKLPKSEWPQQLNTHARMEDEEKTIKVSLKATRKAEGHPLYQINHGNSFEKLLRIMAYIIRSIRLFKHKTSQRDLTPFLNVSERGEALDAIIKEIQKSSFHDELKSLQKGNTVSKSSKLATLTPFIDEKGLIRVGGRLEAAEITYDAKHPIVLPADNFVTNLLLVHLHNMHLHAGPQALHAITRQKYWVLQGRNTTRAVVANCVRCTKLRPRLCNQQMGNLPADRIRQARPFNNCGIDFCGPIYTHYKIRGKRPQKTYIAVFCCFATKAIHLEVVSDLTTEGFLGALKRFIARRGMCENIYCDNGRNFVGAKNQLEEVEKIIMDKYSKEKITNTCNNHKIQFHFSPPRSPHFGGLWEAAVKSTKKLLQKSLLSTSPTYEELCTVTAEVEAILNSRPLTPLSSDPNDMMALTPSHFLIGEPMTATIDTHISETKLSLHSRWALISHIRNEFWRRWSREYLGELQKRNKWINEYPNIKPGTLVIIKDENLPPLKWSMGRVIEAINGPDGKVRVVDVKTATGVLRRAVHQLAPLPVESENENHAETSNERCGERSNENDADERDSTVKNRDARNHRKRKNPSTSTSTLKVFLMTMLVLPILTHTAPTTPLPVQLEELSHNIGIYVESLGKTSITSNSWNLLVYYDLTGYWATIKAIDEIIQHLRKLSRVINHNEYYLEILTQYTHQLQEIKENTLVKNNSSRAKRAPLDVIGTIANKLFGVLDSDYAAQMTETINNVKTNEDHLNELIKNQTSVLETTVNIIKKSEEERVNQTREIEKGIGTVYDKLANMSTEMKQQKAIQSFNTLAILVTTLLNECKFMQEAISDVITDTHHGRANSLVISPNQLQTQITIIKEHLPPDTMLPTVDDQINIPFMYKVMNIHSRVMNNYVIFGIKIPLVRPTIFELYKLVPLPTLVNNMYISITPAMKFLITNIYRDQFYLMTDLEFTQCLHIKDTHYLCEQHRPIRNKNPSNKICEIELFLQQSVPSSCSIKLAQPTKIWIQLQTPNQWLFSLDKAYSVTFVCNNNLIQKTLQGSGLLTLKDDCTMRDQEFTIRTVNQVQSNVASSSFQPKLNLSTGYNISEYDDAPIFTHSTIISHKKEFDSIKNEINHIKLHQTKLQELQPHDIHQFSLAYSTTAVLVVIIIYLIINYVRNRSTVLKIKPEPAPRLTIKDDEYNFEVKDFKRRQDVQT